MATLLSALIDECEADLKDSGNATWLAADVERWVRDGIKDYSEHFPRMLTTTLLTVADDRTYDLPALTREILTAEFPSDQSPASYLARRPYSHPDFWGAVGYFDFIPRRDDTDLPEIWISENPAGSMVGQTITIHYAADHDWAVATNANVTVPARHFPIIRAYVLWQAAVQRAAVQEATPTSNSSLLLSQLSITSDRLRRSYIDKLAKAIQAEPANFGIVSWAGRVDDLIRIY